MKKIVLFALLIALCASAAACAPSTAVQPAPSPSAAQAASPVQTETAAPAQTAAPVSASAQSTATPAARDDGMLFGAAYLGYQLSQADANAALSALFTDDQLALLNSASAPGEESYAITALEGDAMDVYELTLGDNGLTRGDKLLTCDNGGPLYVVCNVSDIAPNICVVIERGGTQYEYIPCISLRDGGLDLGQYAIDIGAEQ